MMSRFLPFFLSLLMISCGKPLPDLSPINLQEWKDDRGGCNGKRITAINELEVQKEKLKGLSEDEIIKVLGRPDRNELYKRNQKFYYYDITPGKTCSENVNGKQLIIRFTAMGYAKEVSIETLP